VKPYPAFPAINLQLSTFSRLLHPSRAHFAHGKKGCCENDCRVLKKTGSFYYHCDWHASHYVKVMLDQIFGENNFLN